MKEIYDHFATTYEANRGQFDMTDVLDTLWQRQNLSEGRLLDLGCGAGEPFSSFYIAKGWQVTGVDFSKNMLALASKFCPKMLQIQSDMRNIQFGQQQFDCITSIYSLFHLSVSEQDQLLETAFQWLKPNGYLLFTYASEQYTGEKIFSGTKTFMGQELYYAHTQPDVLINKLKDIGYQVISKESREIGGEIFLWITTKKPA